MSKALSNITEMLQRLETTLLRFTPPPPPGLSNQQDQAGEDNNLHARVNMMEALLFRLDFPDFSKIDTIVQSAKQLNMIEASNGNDSTVLRMNVPTTCPQFQLYSHDSDHEQEGTTDTAAAASTSAQSDVDVDSREAECCDTGALHVDAIVQTDAWEPLSSSKHIVEHENAGRSGARPTEKLFGETRRAQVLQEQDNNDTNSYRNLLGTWVPIDSLQRNDLVKVIAPFVDSTRGVQIQLAKNTIGRILHIDTEGDAEIRFPSLDALRPCERNRWILATMFSNLEKYDGSLDAP